MFLEASDYQDHDAMNKIDNYLRECFATKWNILSRNFVEEIKPVIMGSWKLASRFFQNKTSFFGIVGASSFQREEETKRLKSCWLELWKKIYG